MISLLTNKIKYCNNFYKNYFKYTIFTASIVTATILMASANVNQDYSWSDKAFVNTINKERKSAGFNNLKENTELNILAQKRLKDLVDNDYFAHESPTGNSLDDLLPVSSYKHVIRGENLAYGDFVNEDDVTKAWMESEWHRYNILYKDFKDVGTAHAVAEYQGGRYVVVVQVFGSKKEGISKKVNKKEAKVLARFFENIKS